MKYLYYIYQVCIAAPILLVATIITALVTIVGCRFGDAHYWSFHPARIWSWLIIRLLLLPISVKRLAPLDVHQSYIFVANHQGTFDIFLIYAFLSRPFKWMMKRGLRSIPFVGVACERSGQVFVDKSGPHAVEHTLKQARNVLRDGMSLVVFPEGARTFTGHPAAFRRGAFFLAVKLGLPVVPLSIDGSFDVLPRQRGLVGLAHRHALRLVVGEPIFPQSAEDGEIDRLRRVARQAVVNGMPPERRAFQENPDQ